MHAVLRDIQYVSYTNVSQILRYIYHSNRMIQSKSNVFFMFKYLCTPKMPHQQAEMACLCTPIYEE